MKPGTGIIAALLCMLGAQTIRCAETAAFYDSDPRHLWNRLHRALFVTTASDGTEYGIDSSVARTADLTEGRRCREVAALLDEFLASGQAAPIGDPVKRALLQNDLWTAFDAFTNPWSAAVEEQRQSVASLQVRLAKAIRKLALSSSEIKRLPDTHAVAARSGAFAKSHDPSQPERPFLPPDLFDLAGPWVQIEAASEEMATGRMHTEAVSGRSGFEVFIRLPGGRDETLAYLKKLNLFATPWKLEPARLATVVSTGEQVRWDPLVLHSATPQFPPGTMVALVRRMVLVSDKIEPVVSPIVQGLQMRVYRQIPASFLPPGEARETQDFYELVLRRAKLIAGEAGGMHAIGREEREPQLLFHTHDESEQERLGGHLVLATCINCHSAPGIFSVNSYSRFVGRQVTNPQLLPATNAEDARGKAAAWKRQQFNWGMLKGLLLGNAGE